MFNVGDKVKCIDDGGNSWLTEGKIYKVGAVALGFIHVDNDYGASHPYGNSLFERVSSPVEEKRKELEGALRIIHKYDCVAIYTLKKGYNKNCNIYSRDFKPTIETFVENVFNDQEPVKSPAQIEAEGIAEQMKKLEERLKELSKSL